MNARRKLISVPLALSLSATLFTGLAHAQATTPEPSGGKVNLTGPEPPLGKIDLTTQPPAPPEQRSYHMHDGFYLRGSAGFGLVGANIDDNHPSGLDLGGGGFSVGFDLLIGGSPNVGVAIGGALLVESSISSEFDRDSSATRQDRNYSVFIVGPFIDGYPMPNGGWHLGATAGFAALSLEDSGNDGLGTAIGFGGAGWFGHDFWVGEQWSIGPMLRFSGAATSNADDDYAVQNFSAQILFSGVYH